MKTDFIPIDYDYFDFNGRNYAKIIGRNSQGKRICIIDSCPVYLWAILDDKLKSKQSKIDKLIKKISKIQLDSKGRKTKVEKVELHKKQFLDKPVQALKIFATNYKDLHEIADNLGMNEIINRRGYDLGYTTHYINEKHLTPLTWHEIEGELLNNSQEFSGIDMALDVDMCIKIKSFTPIKADNPKTKSFTPKVLAYDIETDELSIGEGEILMVSLVDNKGFKKVITYKKGREKSSNLPYVEYVEDEAALLEKFTECVRSISPDFLIGYFSDGFDLPYLRARAEKHKVKLSLGLDGSQPKFSRGFNMTGKINGIVHMDILRFIKTAYAQYMKSETLTLNEVAKEFLGDSKKPFIHTHSSNLNPKDWKKYYEYNLHDSILVRDLFEKFWPDLVEFSKTTQEPVFDVCRAGLSKYVENYILHNLEKYNEIPEKRPTYNEISSRRRSRGVVGAFVYQPTPGLYNNIAMFDFTSMHTSIIITHNLSKGTLLQEKEKSKSKSKSSNASPKLQLAGKEQQFYFSKKPGFFPEMMKDIFNKRKRFKSEYKADPNVITRARSNAFKVLSASVHGYIGFFGARYYSIESSASILAFVRKYNIDTIEKIKKSGYDVVYGDTDSIAFLTKNQPQNKIKNVLKKLNSELPGLMELELEDFYKRGLWVTTRAGKTGAKKKYAMISDSGELKIRGFETVRRDWCQLSRKVQDNVLRIILEDGTPNRALEFVKETVEKIQQRKVSRDELIIKTQLKKPISEYKAISPHVVAAKKMEEQEIPVTEGNLVEYYIAETLGEKKVKLVREKVKLPHEKGKYNIEYYLNRQILPAVENIFQVFDINIKDIMKDSKQKTLGEF